ncbi:efflux transporter, RND family, MFP subunit [Leptothrix cholodnii SP-6]|uniref:Efflux transporter, RND family, MFP subunit n=1 Tax=Leptothrix cholodnii (strain ATCC 51168 / LMG 8142 / SP-6) TaxID=395495 RepID=B1Y5V1_LEPCP|nr:efflux RND transporter periplasmic adaptor subunit [Leptothrix cholodnii]ACB35997.1 efflux transporter, RND family, MFP subunit [Leptothrix cholodnii SP-6]
MSRLVSSSSPRFLASRWARAVLLAAALSSGAQAAGIEVTTIVVQPSRSSAAVALDGSVQALKQATVAAQVGGNVLSLAVKAGDKVRAGQLLARIDERATAAGLAEGDAAVAQAEAALQRARTELDRTRELLKQGYVSQAAFDNAETQHRATQAGLQQAQAARSQAVLARGFASVTAPFDGLVLATHLDAGDLASPGRPVLTLYAPGTMRAVVQLPASLAAQARSAQQIEIELPDGRIVSPQRRTELPGADAVSQTVEWRLDLAPADSAGLLPGQSVRVRFAGAADRKADAPTSGSSGPASLSVPAGALLHRGELSAVYVAQGTQFVLRAVRSGPVQQGQVKVLAGLKAGERVAVDAIRAGLAQARPAGSASSAP